MSIAAAEMPPTTAAETPVGCPVPLPTFTVDELLALVRDMAAHWDPQNASIYRAMDTPRIQAAVRDLTRLMEAHVTYARRRWRGSGKREHTREVYQVLDETNTPNITIGFLFCLAAGGLFPNPLHAPEPKRPKTRQPR